jgi:hypothetical protein
MRCLVDDSTPSTCVWSPFRLPSQSRHGHHAHDDEEQFQRLVWNLLQGLRYEVPYP